MSWASNKCISFVNVAQRQFTVVCLHEISPTRVEVVGHVFAKTAYQLWLNAVLLQYIDECHAELSIGNVMLVVVNQTMLECIQPDANGVN